MFTLEAADLFCGAGGTSTGLSRTCKKLGLGLRLTAINHWPVAIDTHTANHEYAQHLCASLDAIDPRMVIPGKRLHLLVASPECTHHSNARGGRPVNDQSRASAWQIARWAELIDIENILIENVPEFRSWGPVDFDINQPIKSKKGETYQSFLNSLRSLGYTVEDRVLCAADYGDATTRKRLFIIARKKHAIRWPNPSHYNPNGKNVIKLPGQKPWRTAREIIDWSVPNPSIFSRKKPLAKTTMRRISVGLKKFANLDIEPFLVMMYGTGTARSVNRPVPTVTADGQHVALCEPILVGLEHTGSNGSQVRSVEEPVPAITAHPRIGVMEPFLLDIDHQSNPVAGVRSIDSPVSTVTSKARSCVVEGETREVAFVLGQQSGSVARDVCDPIPTIAGKGAIALTEAFVMGVGGPAGTGKPRSAKQPLKTVLTENHHAVCETNAFIVPQFNEATPKSVDQPVGTITTTSRGVRLVEFLMSVNHGTDGSSGSHASRCKDLDTPVGTLTTKGTYALIQPHLVKYNRTGKANSVDKPLDTVTTKDRFGLVQGILFDGQDGKQYLLDIRLRMLQPHELAEAQGFGAKYKFTGGRTVQVKQIGNAVPVNLAKALTAAIVKDYVQDEIPVMPAAVLKGNYANVKTL